MVLTLDTNTGIVETYGPQPITDADLVAARQLLNSYIVKMRKEEKSMKEKQSPMSLQAENILLKKQVDGLLDYLNKYLQSNN